MASVDTHKTWIVTLDIEAGKIPLIILLKTFGKGVLPNEFTK
jgi:hypothetical protein